MAKNTNENTEKKTLDADKIKEARDLVTDLKIFPIKEPKGSTQAFCSVELGGLLTVRDCRIVEGKHGLFLSMPSKQIPKKDGAEGEMDNLDLVYFAEHETKLGVQDEVLDRYAKEVGKPAKKPAGKTGFGKRK